jgi:metal-responsive CopG/Arc/MetJ family transcriptional regulator
MKRITINISDKQHKEFSRIAKEEGLTISELIRRALDEYLKKQKRVVMVGDKPTSYGKS